MTIRATAIWTWKVIATLPYVYSCGPVQAVMYRVQYIHSRCGASRESGRGLEGGASVVIARMIRLIRSLFLVLYCIMR